MTDSTTTSTATPPTATAPTRSVATAPTTSAGTAPTTATATPPTATAPTGSGATAPTTSTSPTAQAAVPGEATVVAVTGANGYVGGLVTGRLAAAGRDVVALRRTPGRTGAAGGAAERDGAAGEDGVAGQDGAARGSRLRERRFVLGEPLDPATLEGVDTVVHCAWDLGLTDPREIRRVNVFGTLRLLDAASAAGVKRVVLVSSMSAYAGTAQVYGRAKLDCEQAVLEAGGAAVRLGLVYGAGWGGMAGSLRKLLALPVVPLMGGDSHQFTVHEDDAAAGLLAVCAAGAPPAAAVGLAHPDPVRFRDLLDGFARQAGLRPRYLPVPWQPVRAGMLAAERIGVPLPLRADSLLGLVRPAPGVPGVEEWSRLGVTLRPFDL